MQPFRARVAASVILGANLRPRDVVRSVVASANGRFHFPHLKLVVLNILV